MISKDWKKELLTIPNLLSLFRLVLIPVYVVIYLNAKAAADYYLAAGVLAVSCLTDLIDGKIARHFNMISNVGKILDPFADKVTQFTMVVCLAVKKPILWILIVLFVVKESFQLIAGFMIVRKGKILSGALLEGKISTTVLFITLVLLVLLPNMDYNWVIALTVLDCVCLLISFVGYLRVYITHSSMIQELHPSGEEAN